MSGGRAAAILGAAAFLAGAVGAEVPHLNTDGQAAYREFATAADHRAFAIAPGGAWGWSSQAPSATAAADEALAACRERTRQRCVLYAAEGKTVFDARAWTTLWGPYASASEAARAPEGRRPGERFADLAFKDLAEREQRLSQRRGKVVVVHFWASWCRPCRRELPELQALRDSLKDRRDIDFVLLQAREDIAVSRRWVREQGLDLPLYDSGARGDDSAAWRLADGRSVPDRNLAPGFPTTYVIDKRGLVVFAHVGDVHGWMQYRDFLLDAARRSGR